MAHLGSHDSVQNGTLSQVFRLVETFRAFDADNDGCITILELGGILASLGYHVSKEEVRAMMQQGDRNKDELLSIDEFLAMNTTKDMVLGNLNGEETITAFELYEVMGNIEAGLSLEDCKQIVATMDVDGDGVTMRRRVVLSQHPKNIWTLQ
ncbi:hypothetical protein ACFE04_026040 [Oxalis oulophora]